jgi:hypothetical protein
MVLITSSHIDGQSYPRTSTRVPMAVDSAAIKTMALQWSYEKTVSMRRTAPSARHRLMMD